MRLLIIQNKKYSYQMKVYKIVKISSTLQLQHESNEYINCISILNPSTSAEIELATFLCCIIVE